MKEQDKIDEQVTFQPLSYFLDHERAIRLRLFMELLPKTSQTQFIETSLLYDYANGKRNMLSPMHIYFLINKYTLFNDRGNKAIRVHRTEYFSQTAGLTAASRMSHGALINADRQMVRSCYCK
jgi:hypothetical protein